MKIKKVTTGIVEIPMIRPAHLSLFSHDTIQYVVVRVLTDDGIEGVGEAAVLGGPFWSEESAESINTMIGKYIAPLIIGENPMQIEALRKKIDRMYRGNYFAKAAVEMALFDIKGKALNVPVYELLGGLVRDRVPLSWTLAVGDPEKEIEEIAQMQKLDGHYIFKFKAGSQPLEKDVERVKRVREVYGDKVSLRMDVNCGWSRSTAVKAVKMLDEYGMDFLEQPIAKRDIEGLAALSRISTTPIMADESNSLVCDALDLIKNEAASVYCLKVTKAGGLINSKTIAGMVEWSGYDAYVGCMDETGIGTAAYLALAASTPCVNKGCELFGPMLLVDDIVNEPIEVVEGNLLVNHRPGLGVTINEEKYRKYLVGEETVVE